MNNGQQAGDTLYEGGIGWTIMLVILAILLWLFWYFYNVEVREAVRWIRYGEMWVISWFVSDDYEILYRGKEYNFQAGLEAVQEYQKEKLKYEHLSYFTALAMQPLRIPLLILISMGAFWCIFKGPKTHYRKRMTLENLIEAQAKVFPVISPFIKFNPSSQPPRPPGAPVPAELPLFAEALGPEEWLAFNSIQVPDGKIDEESASRAFIKQLGKPWRGSKNLDGYKQVLLAAFCLKASRKRDQSDDLLSRLATCWSGNGGLNLSKDRKLLKEAQNILKNKELSAKTLSQVNRHAFETTAMLRALQFAREEGGVSAPAQFVWLRAHDRNLWYPLNNMGRQSFHMESLGAMSHFKAEKLTMRPIPVPKVEHALQTIQEYMQSPMARPIPQLDYTNSKKRGVKKAI